MIFPSELRFGDWIGYRHKGDLMSEAIHLKTGGIATHSAVYHGDSIVVTSLAGGVNYYPIDLTGIAIVRRLQVPFNLKKADDNFDATIRGMPYGIWDDLKDALPDLPDTSKGINCSHASVLYYFGGGVPLVASDFDLKTFTPRDFELVPDCYLRTIYVAEPAYAPVAPYPLHPASQLATPPAA